MLLLWWCDEEYDPAPVPAPAPAPRLSNPPGLTPYTGLLPSPPPLSLPPPLSPALLLEVVAVVVDPWSRSSSASEAMRTRVSVTSRSTSFANTWKEKRKEGRKKRKVGKVGKDGGGANERMYHGSEREKINKTKQQKSCKKKTNTPHPLALYLGPLGERGDNSDGRQARPAPTQRGQDQLHRVDHQRVAQHRHHGSTHLHPHPHPHFDGQGGQRVGGGVRGGGWDAKCGW